MDTMEHGSMHAKPAPSHRHQSGDPNATSSASSSSSPHASNHEADQTTQNDVGSDSGSSSEEEGGIFFGQHTDAESRFLAKLSGASPSPPASPKCNRRQSRLVSRLRRDSTEFHRRKTMVFPIQLDEEDDNDEEENDESRMEDNRMQERYQQEVSLLQISPSAFTSDLRASLPSFVTSRRAHNAFAGLPASSPIDKPQHPESQASDTSSESDASSDGGHSESDKENSFMPDGVTGEVDEDIEEGAIMTVTMGMGDPDADFVLTDGLALDLGGMKLSDFADLEDPDEGSVTDQSVSYDSSESEGGDPLDSPTIHLAPLPLHNEMDLVVPDSEEVESSVEDSLERVQTSPCPAQTTEPSNEVKDVSSGPAESRESGFAVLEDETPIELDDPSATQAPDPGATMTSPLPPSSSVLAEKDVNVEEHPFEQTPTTESDDVDSESDDLPVSRAAHSALPYSPHEPMRMSESSFRSPLTSYPAPNMASPFALPSLDPTPLADMTSPTRTPSLIPSTTPARTPRQLGPLPTTSTPSQVRGDLAPLAERSSKVLKPRLPPSLPKAEAPAPATYKEKSRTLAVRGKLDSIFSSKVGSMGPPQRTVSASSIASSSSSSSGNRPASRAGVPAKSDAKSSTSKSISGISRPGSSLSTRPMPVAASRPAMPPPTHVRPAASSASHSTSVRPTLGASTAASRPALAPRSLVTHPAIQAHARPTDAKTSRPVASSAPKQMGMPRPHSISISGPAPAVQVNPLKRPLSHSALQSAGVRQTVGTGNAPPRPALGLPSRLVRDVYQPRGGPVFHVGLGPTDTSSSRQAYRSPLRLPPQRGMSTPQAQRIAKMGTPSRLDLTPRNGRAKPLFQTLSHPTDRPVQDISSVSPSKSSGPPASATRYSEQGQSSNAVDDAQRGSSADYEDVSMMLPQPPSSSPPVEQQATPPDSSTSQDDAPKTRSKVDEDKAELGEDDKGRRPKRAVKPPPSRARTPAPPAAPYMSGKELKTTTDRNTSRNQVYSCAIDRQVVRIPGPRPPSPTSKIRTTADRDEEEKKKSREHRAKRRARDSGASTDAGSPDRPVIQRVERARGPGDEEDWKTPARPIKKAKLREEKNVKWDKGLVIIHDDGSAVAPPSTSDADVPLKGCVRQAAIVNLDKNGNIIESTRPRLELKRNKITVTAVFYEGEEPVPEAPPASSSSGTKKKK